MKNVKIFQHDISKGAVDNLGLDNGTISGIITSPPYLCMADYTLGQRLSYLWLYPDKLNEDYVNEIGARRTRGQKGPVLDEYFSQMRSFARNSAILLKSNGFLATVIGEPSAEAFKDKKILGKLDEIFKEEGYNLFWETNRPISLSIPIHI